eukprot:CAMPEP_0115005300 /NCGR_PEP_ID=MMETSP0216-20121206/19772_1 /TAXON_ID=223996 /ORGANISM="Protocruzia adherens, Strain Boccale" /LENGTH=218 /DNA_ID=CAMNT_0002371565 /DNA_START=372 /DNA_END=1029 /DNA_ORIENTATION=-
MSSTLQHLYLEQYQSSLPDIIAKAEEELSKPKPMLDAALQGLNVLRKQDLKELSSLRMPPDVVKRVLDVVCVYLKVMPTWAESKKWLKDPKLVGRLVQLPLEDGAFSLKEMKKAEKLLEAVPSRLHVARCSKACVTLYDWCLAVTNVCRVRLMVGPYIEKRKELEVRIELLHDIIDSDPLQVKSGEPFGKSISIYSISCEIMEEDLSFKMKDWGIQVA